MTRVAWVIELAASRPSAGTTRGTSAPRAGLKNVPIDAWTSASRTTSGMSSARPDDDEPEHDDRAQRVGDDHHPAPVPAVDVGARDDPDRQRRDGQRDRDRGEGEGRVGELVDEEQQRQQRHPVADVGDGLGRPQPPEVGDAQDVAHGHRRRARLGAHRSSSSVLGVGHRIEAEHEAVRASVVRRGRVGRIEGADQLDESLAERHRLGGAEPGQALRDDELRVRGGAPRRPGSPRSGGRARCRRGRPRRRWSGRRAARGCRSRGAIDRG